MQHYSDSYPTVEEVLDSHIDEIPQLHRPVMLVALQGWFDATRAATGALDWLMDARNCVTVASIESDPFFDFTQARPEIWIDEDDERHVRWPENEVVAVHNDTDGRDLVIISGVEPHLHWPTFVACIVKCAKDLRCAAVVTVGAMLDAVPHTRTPVVTGSTTSNALASKLG
ncbi:MAG: PAC2 family protein, partial [Ilumatobacteraceae bacterium]